MLVQFIQWLPVFSFGAISGLTHSFVSSLVSSFVRCVQEALVVDIVGVEVPLSLPPELVCCSVYVHVRIECGKSQFVPWSGLLRLPQIVR